MIMVKSIEQLNREFLEEYLPAGDSTEPVVISEAIPEPGEPPAIPETETPEPLHHPITPPKQAAHSTPLWKDMLLLLVKIGGISLAGILLLTFLFGVMRYPDSSMDAAIKDGDLVVYYRYTKSGYLPRDTVALEKDGAVQVRRVIATEGDTVDITENGLYINGALQQETEIHQQTERYLDGVSFPLTVPEGHIFVLGDNRAASDDSRIYGCVRIKDTLGKVMTVIRRRDI